MSPKISHMSPKVNQMSFNVYLTFPKLYIPLQVSPKCFQMSPNLSQMSTKISLTYAKVPQISISQLLSRLPRSTRCLSRSIKHFPCSTNHHHMSPKLFQMSLKWLPRFPKSLRRSYKISHVSSKCLPRSSKILPKYPKCLSRSTICLQNVSKHDLGSIRFVWMWKTLSKVSLASHHIFWMPLRSPYTIFMVFHEISQTLLNIFGILWYFYKV